MQSLRPRLILLAFLVLPVAPVPAAEPAIAGSASVTVAPPPSSTTTVVTTPSTSTVVTSTWDTPAPVPPAVPPPIGATVPVPVEVIANPILPSGPELDNPANTTGATGAPPSAAGTLPPRGQARRSGNVQAIDRQVNHANGSSMVLRSIDLREDAIVIEATVINGSAREIRLNRDQSFVLRDSKGNVYRLSAPPENASLAIPPGGKLDGELVFLGRIAPGATSIVLATNDGLGGSADNRHDQTPSFRVEIPITRSSSELSPARDGPPRSAREVSQVGDSSLSIVRG